MAVKKSGNGHVKAKVAVTTEVVSAAGVYAARNTLKMLPQIVFRYLPNAAISKLTEKVAAGTAAAKKTAGTGAGAARRASGIARSATGTASRATAKSQQ